jgi:hypothetical protein
MPFIVELRKLTGCGLADAKATLHHIAIQPGVCHWCGSALGSEAPIVDCARCRSLNLQVRPADEPR